MAGEKNKVDIPSHYFKGLSSIVIVLDPFIPVEEHLQLSSPSGSKIDSETPTSESDTQIKHSLKAQIESWLTLVHEKCEKITLIYLILTKSDCMNEAQLKAAEDYLKLSIKLGKANQSFIVECCFNF